MTLAVEMAVHVRPRSGRDAIEGVDERGALRIRVTAAPADGAANAAVTRLVAKAAGLPRSAVSVAAGTRSRHKQLRLEGANASALRERWPGVSVRQR